MWELDYKESWVPKNWCFELWCWRRLLRVPWTARRFNQSILKEISPKYSLEGLVFCHLLWRTDFRKDADAGKNWKQEEKGMTTDEIVGWHHRLNGHEFKQAPGVGDGQESLACYSPWGRRESDTTQQLNWNLMNVSNMQKNAVNNATFNLPS